MRYIALSNVLYVHYFFKYRIGKQHIFENKGLSFSVKVFWRISLLATFLKIVLFWIHWNVLEESLQSAGLLRRQYKILTKKIMHLLM